MGVGGDLGEWEFGGGGAVGVCHELCITHGKVVLFAVRWRMTNIFSIIL
jgi:hypothetical protein